MKDRVVENPNRYRLVPVEGQKDVVDLVWEPGRVKELGTPLNKSTLLSDRTAMMFGAEETRTVSEALERGSGMSSLMAFATNSNTDSIDAAFGKGNENSMVGLGRQLAMYAWFRGEDSKARPYSNLRLLPNASRIAQNEAAIAEIKGSESLLELIALSPYASETLTKRVMLYDCGRFNTDYVDFFSCTLEDTYMQMKVTWTTTTSTSCQSNRKIDLTGIDTLYVMCDRSGIYGGPPNTNMSISVSGAGTASAAITSDLTGLVVKDISGECYIHFALNTRYNVDSTMKILQIWAF